DDADDGAQFAAAEMGFEAQVADAFQDVINLLRGGVWPKNDNHGRVGESGANSWPGQWDSRSGHPDHRCQPLVVATGKEPRTVSFRQCSSSAFRARLTLASSRWPSKSTKKMYSGLGVLAGNDSIQVRLILFCLNTSRA